MRNITPLAGAKNSAGLAQTDLVNCKVRCFKQGFNPAENTTAADLIAQECDFDDYVAKVIAAWGNPVLAPVSGYQIVAPTQSWIVVTNATPNVVGGYWIETAAGVLVSIVQFDDPGVAMNNVDDALYVTPVVFVPTQNLSA